MIKTPVMIKVMRTIRSAKGKCAFKQAAIINILIVTMDQMTVCSVKAVTRSDECTDNYQTTLQFQIYGASAYVAANHCNVI